MKNKAKRSFLVILPLGFCLIEVIALSPSIPFLVPERNNGTMSDIKFQYFYSVVTITTIKNRWLTTQLFEVCYCVKVQSDTNESIGGRFVFNVSVPIIL